MKDTAPKELGILAVAALFGLVALVVSYAVLDFAGFASCLIGVIVAVITAIVLWLGWREAAPGPMGARDLSPSGTAASDATTAPAATAEATPAPTAAPAAFASSAATADVPAAAPTPAAKSKPAAKPKPAAKAAKPAAKTAKPAVKAAAAKPAKPAAAKAAPAAKTAKPVAADGKPETLTKARAGGADDLKQLKGVGPKLETTLNELGFYHFDQVAGWRKAEIEWVDSRLKFKGRIVRDEWIKQAKVLAKGGTTEFSKKVKKGGVY